MANGELMIADSRPLGFPRAACSVNLAAVFCICFGLSAFGFKL
jgi:hypothetical protein